MSSNLFNTMLLKAMVTSSGADWSLYDGTKNKSPVLVNANTSSVDKAIPINSTDTLLLVRDSGSGLQACISTIDASGNATIGSLSIINGNVAGNGSSWACITDSSHAVIVYYDPNIPGVQALAINFTGTTINTVGTPVTFFSGTSISGSVGIANLSSSSFLIICDNAATAPQIIAIYGTISGTTLTAPASNTTTISSVAGVNNVRFQGIDCLDGSSSIATWVEVGTTNVKACSVIISGNTPVGAMPITINNLGLTFLSTPPIMVRRITNTTGIIVWGAAQTITGNIVIQGNIVTLGGGTISAGTTVDIYNPGTAPGSINMVGCAVPNSTQVVVSFAVGSTDMRTGVCTIAGNVITPLTTYETTTSTSSITTLGNCEIGTNYAAFLYTDSNASNHAQLIVLSPI